MNVKVRDIINALLLYNVTITHRFCLLQKRMLKGAPWKIYVYFFWSQLSPTNKLAQKPTIEFIHDAILPTSSTCSLIIRLPTVHKTYTSFRDALILGLKSNDGFGGP